LNEVYFLLDEYATLGHLPQVGEGICTLRKYGVHFGLFFQACEQIERNFPNGEHKTVLANSSQTYWAIADLGTAKEVSERLGHYTIIVASGGNNRGGSFSSAADGRDTRGWSWGRNDNWSQVGRPLSRPEELMTLPPRCAISFVPGIPPICTTLKPYWEADEQTGLWAKAKTLAVATLLLIGTAAIDALLLASLEAY
jgi:type IV secretion system protein VirD4